MNRATVRSLAQLVRYYQAGIVNTAFGYGAYAALVALGLNMFLAQLVAHVAGTVFNYWTYSRYAFRGSAPARGRFILSYVFTYLLSLACLAAASRIIASPYLAGLAAVILVSLLNYVILSTLVFRRGAGA